MDVNKHLGLEKNATYTKIGCRIPKLYKLKNAWVKNRPKVFSDNVEFVERAFSSYYKLNESLQFLRGILYCYDFLDA